MPRFFQPSSESKNPHETYHSSPEEGFIPKISESGEIRTLLLWEAPSRPFRKKDRSYYTTSAILVVLFILIALRIQEFLLIGVLLSLTFVSYVLAFIPPGNVTYKISTQGITIGENFYFWHTLDAFWFKDRENSKVLIIPTRLRFPAQLMLVLGDGVLEEEVKRVVARFLPFHESPHKTMFEKWSEGLQKHFPLENTHH